MVSALRRHGVVPRQDTDARRVRSFLNELYTFQLRRLRAMRREAERLMGPQPIGPYRRQVRELKERYDLLSLPTDRWPRR